MTDRLVKEDRTRAWIERVRAADAEAERAWEYANNDFVGTENALKAAALAIAAELRAQRIARRSGAGK